jgi:hypothetical protein
MRLQCRSGREWAAAPAVVAEQGDAAAVAVVPAAVVAARVEVLAVVAARPEARAADAAKVAVDQVADAGAMENRAIVTADGETAAVSSSRTSSPSTALPRS